MECKICKKEFSSLMAYVDHFVLHSQIFNVRYDCGIPNCSKQFVTVSALKAHTLREHGEHRRVESTTAQGRITNITNLPCTHPQCVHVCVDNASLLSHLRQHIDEGQIIRCPFDDCEKEYHNKNSLSTHVFRVHRERTFATAIEPTNDDECHDNNFYIASYHNNVNMADDVQNTSLLSMDESDYIKALAQFYLKLQCVYFVPSRTVDLIVSELQSLTHYGNRFFCREIINKIQPALPADVRDCILNELANVDLFQAAHCGPLRTDYMRKEYCRKNLRYVPPVQYILGNMVNHNEKAKYYHYVPIERSLVALFSDESVVRDYNISQANRTLQTNELRDITDGTVFKNNALFQSYPDSIGLILYCDSFEVVNPLGSARCKHKVLAVYFSLLNILPHNRSSINQIQLALLCNEKEFDTIGQDFVFFQLVSDIKRLETEGVCITALNNRLIRATVVAIVADNLGAHALGGFTKNFASAEYFCRFCTLSRTEFKGDNMCELGSRRTPDSYMTDTQAVTDGVHVNGVVSNSIFNQLQYYHVCNPGLPPCIAHDIFEGVVAYDMKLFINHFIKVRKWFTCDYFNHKISTFKYQGSDATSKPCHINATGEKLQGSASQNWCLLRLFPLLIGSKILDYEDPAWVLVTMLREISELACAQKITHQNIACLESLTAEYLSIRSENFPQRPLRPKHHFMRHYAQMTLYFGPLIRLWTLRFESKHTFFKKVARSHKNFINLTQSLSENHQLLQCLISAGSLLKPELDITNSIIFNLDVYNDCIQNSAIEFGLHSLNSIVCQKLCLRGMDYTKGLFLAIAKTDNNLTVGEIMLIVVKNNSQVFFIVRTICLEHLPHLHVYRQLSLNSDHVICVPESDLLDYYPLCGYFDEAHHLCFALKHTV